jgi:hypothetical protein
MKRFQVRCQGVSSKARRAFQIRDFENVLTSFYQGEDQMVGLFAAAAHTVQFSKLDERDLVIYKPFPQYAVKITVAWSKNVWEERVAPSQLLIGAMDSRFCVLLNLGLWMEFIAEQHPEPNNHFLFKVDLDDPLRILSVYNVWSMLLLKLPVCC